MIFRLQQNSLFFEFWRGSAWNRAKKGRVEAGPALFTDSQDG
jgi:hypothetical protein